MDNLVAPTVSTLGDVLTIPALCVASLLLGHEAWRPRSTVLWCVGDRRCSSCDLGARLGLLRQIVRESLPVLTAAVVLSTLAGVALEKQLAIFASLQGAAPAGAGVRVLRRARSVGILSSRVGDRPPAGHHRADSRPGRARPARRG